MSLVLYAKAGVFCRRSGISSTERIAATIRGDTESAPSTEGNGICYFEMGNHKVARGQRHIFKGKHRLEHSMVRRHIRPMTRPSLAPVVRAAGSATDICALQLSVPASSG